ncbi:MAG: NUDIX hydrolase [Candidatus Neomicrothrix subdominans]|nr:NUDIX hydrolase [Candidatus Microthrix sp.]MBP7594392.1 NUDIX hydrolase [Candidatus Microthrix sp.]
MAVGMISEEPHLVPILDAATVVLLRDSDGTEPTGTPGPGLEVLMMRRNLDSDFVGGAYIFPGGAVDPDDDPVAQPRIVHEQLPSSWELAPRVAAVREAFEEAGLLLARRSHQADMVSLDEPEAARLIDGLHPETGGDRSSTPSWRELIDSGSANMAQLCVAEDLVLAVDRLMPLSRWTTPLGANRRYDTRFYVTGAPPRQVALHDNVELVSTRWVAPSQALSEAAAGTITMIFPTVVTMHWLNRFESTSEALAALDGRDDPTAVTPELVVEGDRLVIMLPDGSRYDAETAAPLD